MASVAIAEAGGFRSGCRVAPRGPAIRATDFPVFASLAIHGLAVWLLIEATASAPPGVLADNVIAYEVEIVPAAPSSSASDIRSSAPPAPEIAQHAAEPPHDPADDQTAPAFVEPPATDVAQSINADPLPMVDPPVEPAPATETATSPPLESTPPPALMTEDRAIPREEAAPAPVAASKRPVKPRPVPVPAPREARTASVGGPAANPIEAAPSPTQPAPASPGREHPATPAPAAVVATAAPAMPIIVNPSFRMPPAPPVYPKRARDLDQQGEALVRARLDRDGNAEEIVLWRSSGYDLLDNAALSAVRRWQFEPARRDGEPIVAWVQVPVRFFLR